MDLATLVNNIGITAEIIGFLFILRAIRMVKPEGGGFTSQWDKVGNVMSTLHPRWNTIGIILVIVGLIFQLISPIIH